VGDGHPPGRAGTARPVTAGLLAAGGVLLIAAGSTGLALTGLGILLYTVIASPGYFIARHEWAPPAMFAVLAVLAIAAIAGAVGL
jgi:hypothetical protein